MNTDYRQVWIDYIDKATSNSEDPELVFEQDFVVTSSGLDFLSQKLLQETPNDLFPQQWSVCFDVVFSTQEDEAEHARRLGKSLVRFLLALTRKMILLGEIDNAVHNGDGYLMPGFLPIIMALRDETVPLMGTTLTLSLVRLCWESAEALVDVSPSLEALEILECQADPIDAGIQRFQLPGSIRTSSSVVFPPPVE